MCQGRETAALLPPPPCPPEIYACVFQLPIRCKPSNGKISSTSTSL